MVKRILIVLLWARSLEVCLIILSSFTVIFLRLDRLWMKYNSQILACKQKQRCGWLGPWIQLSIIVICTNTTTIFGMCLVFLTGKTQAIMFMTLPKVYSQHEKLSKESEKISIKVKFSYCLSLRLISPTTAAMRRGRWLSFTLASARDCSRSVNCREHACTSIGIRCWITLGKYTGRLVLFATLTIAARAFPSAL